MSKITLEPNSSGAGTFSIVSPDSNTNRTVTLPDDSGSLVLNSGATFTGPIDLSGSDFIRLPIGTSGERPNNPNDGDLRFNTDTLSPELYAGGAWGGSGSIIGFDYAQSGTEESFSAGDDFYPRTTYLVTATVRSSTDLVMINGRISWSISDADDEIGFGWMYRSLGTSTWQPLRDNNATGDVFNGREGTVVGTHNDNFNDQLGGRAANMNIIWIPGSAGTYEIVPAVFGNSNTGSTVRINRFANNNSSKDWDRKASSTVTAMVLTGGIIQ